MTERALIAMSGGVDSSVAAYIMQRRGFDCVGCTMKLYGNEDAGIPKGHTCCSLNDVEDARAVCRRLGMRHYVFNFSEDFREKVIAKFARSYENGLTPNPCIDCNRYMKFEKLYERAKLLGCDYVVTGHYARIERGGEKFVLKKAADAGKDQSYVLYTMTQEQLAQTIFPLGDTEKAVTRAIAAENGFVNAAKPDSQDICFAPDGDYARVIELYTGKKAPEGDFVDKSGRVLGRHRGLIRYTVGQRRGLGIAAAEPLYVCALCPENNTVVLGANKELYSVSAECAEFNWISGDTPRGAIRCRAKIRYRQPEQSATAFPHADGSVSVRFDEPQRAITPGQALVLYDGDTVLGGGVILG